MSRRGTDLAGPPDSDDRGLPPVSGRAARLHRDAVVVDMHADTPTEFFLRPDYDFDREHGEGHIDLPRLRRAGIDVEAFIAWIPEELAAVAGASAAHAIRLILAIHDVLGRAAGVRITRTAAELRASLAAADVAALIGIEGGHALEGSMERLTEFHGLGVRYLTLTWNNTHDWADACCSPARHGGLSELGRRIVRELERLGVLIDVSHAAETTFWQTLDAVGGPVIASHSCARALADHPRNLTDDQIRALAASGGVVGINFFPGFLDQVFGARYYEIDRRGARLEARLRARGVESALARSRARAWRQERWRRIPTIPLDRIADHIIHVASVAGIRHVGLGSDFDGIPVLPGGLRDAGDLPRLTDRLLERGLGEEELRDILGHNFLRVLDRVLP